MASRSRRWLREVLVFVVLAVLVGTAIGLYQQRDVPRDQAPALAGELLTGGTFDLAALSKEGPVLIYFWATWCAYCKVVSPAVSGLAEEYQVVSVALQSGNDEDVKRFMARDKISMPTLNDPSGLLSHRWGVRVTPTIVIVGSDGRVQWVTSGATSKLGLEARLAMTD